MINVKETAQAVSFFAGGLNSALFSDTQIRARQLLGYSCFELFLNANNLFFIGFVCENLLS